MLIIGTNGHDPLPGTPQSDIINGLAGNDTISGRGGADAMNGGDGNDLIGFAFDLAVDTVIGGTGLDRLVGPPGIAGPVTMTGNLASGANIFSGGQLIVTAREIEALSLTASNANDSLFGGIGDDSITALAGRDTVSTGSGNDTVRIAIDANADAIDMGASVGDTFGASYAGALRVDFGVVRNIGTVRLNGQAVASVSDAEIFEIKGGNGHDSLTGGLLGDQLDGGLGANTLSGSWGDDVFTLTLDAFTDDVRGGNGLDRLRVLSNGRDRVVAELVGPGFYDVTLNNVVRIGASGIEAADVFGGTQHDIIDGLVGIDLLLGNAGNDVIDGGAGDDNIFGGTGNDNIAGGQGNDLIQADAGNDRLTGNLGNDRFIFSHPFADGKDYVVDFAATDFIAVKAAGFAGLVAGRPVALVKSANALPPAGSLAPVFLFDTDTGDLSFDRDGAGAAAALAFASIHTGAGAVYSAFVAGDILVI